VRWKVVVHLLNTGVIFRTISLRLFGENGTKCLCDHVTGIIIGFIFWFFFQIQVCFYVIFLGGNHFTYTRHEPVGVCGQIIPVSDAEFFYYRHFYDNWHSDSCRHRTVVIIVDVRILIS